MNGSVTRLGVAIALCGLMVGCATTQQADLAEVRAIAEQAMADAAAAKQAAADAQASADAAMDTAASANAQSQETEAKIDRMFKKAMYK